MYIVLHFGNFIVWTGITYEPLLKLYYLLSREKTNERRKVIHKENVKVSLIVFVILIIDV